jgi:uncharacterized membrane protein (DUF2068 family)
VAQAKTALKAPPKRAGSTGLMIIGLYKLFEAVLLLAVGIGLLRLVHRDVAAFVLHWVHVLRADPDNHYIHRLLSKVFSVSPKQLRELSVGTFFYAALRLAEGGGLVMRKRWAEYLTVIATALFIPLEIYELILHFTLLKLAVFAGNVAIVWYLASGLRRTH